MSCLVADECDRSRLLELADLPSLSFNRWEAVGEGANVKFQEVSRRRESTAKKVQNFEWAVISGLLQTPDYMAALFSALPYKSGKLEAFVHARLARQSLVRHRKQEIFCVMSEQALRSRFSSRVTYLAQLRHIIASIEAAEISVSILPTACELPSIAMSPFWLFDTTLVTVESLAGELSIIDPVIVKRYEKQFATFYKLAVRGEEAIRLVKEVESTAY